MSNTSKQERSGRNWAAIRETVMFRAPAPLLEQPMEISLALLRGLRTVDECIVMIGEPERREPLQ